MTHKLSGGGFMDNMDLDGNTDHKSTVLGNVDVNTQNLNLDEENYNQLAFCGGGPTRKSLRRSSILKIGDANDKRGSRRVSWAQTYQFKKLLSDGTTVVTSQELNKYGPEPNKNDQEIRRSSGSDNMPHIDKENEPKIDDNIEMLNENVKNVVKRKFNNEHLTKVLSKYYNPGNVKDYETVINTAYNKFGIEVEPGTATTDLTQIVNENNSNEKNLTKFLKHFKVGEENAPNNKIGKTTTNNAKEIDMTNLNHSSMKDISNVDDNVDTNCLNSTKISSEQLSVEEFWQNFQTQNYTTIAVASPDAHFFDINRKKNKNSKEFQIFQDYQKAHHEKSSIHETTMMIVSDESEPSKTNFNPVIATVQQPSTNVHQKEPSFLAQLNLDLSLDLSSESDLDLSISKAVSTKENSIKTKSVQNDCVTSSAQKPNSNDLLAKLVTKNVSCESQSAEISTPTEKMDKTLIQEKNENKHDQTLKQDDKKIKSDFNGFLELSEPKIQPKTFAAIFDDDASLTRVFNLADKQDGQFCSTFNFESKNKDMNIHSPTENQPNLIENTSQKENDLVELKTKNFLKNEVSEMDVTDIDMSHNKIVCQSESKQVCVGSNSQKENISTKPKSKIFLGELKIPISDENTDFNLISHNSFSNVDGNKLLSTSQKENDNVKPQSDALLGQLKNKLTAETTCFTSSTNMSITQPVNDDVSLTRVFNLAAKQDGRFCSTFNFESKNKDINLHSPTGLSLTKINKSENQSKLSENTSQKENDLMELKSKNFLKNEVSEMDVTNINMSDAEIISQSEFKQVCVGSNSQKENISTKPKSKIFLGEQKIPISDENTNFNLISHNSFSNVDENKLLSTSQKENDNGKPQSDALLGQLKNKLSAETTCFTSSTNMSITHAVDDFQTDNNPVTDFDLNLSLTKVQEIPKETPDVNSQKENQLNYDGYLEKPMTQASDEITDFNLNMSLTKVTEVVSSKSDYMITNSQKENIENKVEIDKFLEKLESHIPVETTEFGLNLSLTKIIDATSKHDVILCSQKENVLQTPIESTGLDLNMSLTKVNENDTDVQLENIEMTLNDQENLSTKPNSNGLLGLLQNDAEMSKDNASIMPQTMEITNGAELTNHARKHEVNCVERTFDMLLNPMGKPVSLCQTMEDSFAQTQNMADTVDPFKSIDDHCTQPLTEQTEAENMSFDLMPNENKTDADQSMQMNTNQNNDSMLSKSFENNSNVSIIELGNAPTLSPNDFSDIKVEIFEITNNRLNDNEKHTAYVPTKPILGKFASTIMDEDEMDLTSESQMSQNDCKDVSIQEKVADIDEDGIENKNSISKIHLEGEKNDEENSSHSVNLQTDEADVSAVLPSNENEAMETENNEPCVVDNTQDDKTSVSPNSFKRPNTSLMKNQLAEKKAKTVNNQLKTNCYPLAEINSELASLSSRTGPMLQNHSHTVSYKFTSLPQISSFQTCKPMLGGTSRISRVSSVNNRNNLTTLSTGTFNHLIQPNQTFQPASSVKKQDIELDFNKSQEALSMKISNNSTVNNENTFDEISSLCMQSTKFIRKSLGFNIKDKLIQKCKEMEQKHNEQLPKEQKETKENDQTLKENISLHKANTTISKENQNITSKSLKNIETSNIFDNRSILGGNKSINTTNEACQMNNKSMSESYVCKSKEDDKTLKDDISTKANQSSIMSPIRSEISNIQKEKTEENQDEPEETCNISNTFFDVDLPDSDKVVFEESKMLFEQTLNFSMHNVSNDSVSSATMEELFQKSASVVKLETMDVGEQNLEKEKTLINEKNEIEPTENEQQNSLIVKDFEDQVDDNCSILQSSVCLNDNTDELTEEEVPDTTSSEVSMFNFTIWRNEFSRTIDFGEMENSLCLKLTKPVEVEFETVANKSSLYRIINQLDYKALHLRIQSLQPDLFVVRFLWSTLELRIRFGSVITPLDACNNSTEIRDICALDLISLLNSRKELPYELMMGAIQEPLYDGDRMLLRFQEEHRALLNVAHDYVLTHFEEKRSLLMKNYRDSSKLLQLVNEFSLIVSCARKLVLELRFLYSKEVFQILPRDSEGRFRISVEILALRKPIQLYIAFDPLMYPDEVIHPVIVIPEEDKHLYPIHEFSAALLMIKPCNFNYISNLIQGAKYFVRALRKVMVQTKRHRKQSEEIRCARLD